MTTNVRDFTEELRPLYRYSVEAKEWQYLDTEHGWTIVSSQLDAKNMALHSAVTMGLECYHNLASQSEPVSNAIPGYAPPPPLVDTVAPTNDVSNDFSITRGWVWYVIAFVISVAVTGITSQFTASCV